MSDKTTIGIAAAGAATVLAVALAATSGDEPSKLDGQLERAETCSYTLGTSGSFIVPDDAGRCDLVYPPGTRLRCKLVPVTDVTYQWSYKGTPLGIVTTGLKSGAVIGFECKGAR